MNYKYYYYPLSHELHDKNNNLSYSEKIYLPLPNEKISLRSINSNQFNQQFQCLYYPPFYKSIPLSNYLPTTLFIQRRFLILTSNFGFLTKQIHSIHLRDQLQFVTMKKPLDKKYCPNTILDLVLVYGINYCSEYVRLQWQPNDFQYIQTITNLKSQMKNQTYDLWMDIQLFQYFYQEKANELLQEFYYFSLSSLHMKNRLNQPDTIKNKNYREDLIYSQQNITLQNIEKQNKQNQTEKYKKLCQIPKPWRHPLRSLQQDIDQTKETQSQEIQTLEIEHPTQRNTQQKQTQEQIIPKIGVTPQKRLQGQGRYLSPSIANKTASKSTNIPSTAITNTTVTSSTSKNYLELMNPELTSILQTSQPSSTNQFEETPLVKILSENKDLDKALNSTSSTNHLAPKTCIEESCTKKNETDSTSTLQLSTSTTRKRLRKVNVQEDISTDDEDVISISPWDRAKKKEKFIEDSSDDELSNSPINNPTNFNKNPDDQVIEARRSKLENLVLRKHSQLGNRRRNRNEDTNVSEYTQKNNETENNKSIEDVKASSSSSDWSGSSIHDNWNGPGYSESESEDNDDDEPYENESDTSEASYDA